MRFFFFFVCVCFSLTSQGEKAQTCWILTSSSQGQKPHRKLREPSTAGFQYWVVVPACSERLRSPPLRSQWPVKLQPWRLPNRILSNRVYIANAMNRLALVGTMTGKARQLVDMIRRKAYTQLGLKPHYPLGTLRLSICICFLWTSWWKGKMRL